MNAEDRPAAGQESVNTAAEFLRAMLDAPERYDDPALETALWVAICEGEGRIFRTKRGMEFTYTVNGNELRVSRRSKTIVRSSVNLALRKALRLNRRVAGPKKLEIYGASYIYPIFQSIGVILLPEDIDMILSKEDVEDTARVESP